MLRTMTRWCLMCVLLVSFSGPAGAEKSSAEPEDEQSPTEPVAVEEPNDAEEVGTEAEIEGSSTEPAAIEEPNEAEEVGTEPLIVESSTAPVAYEEPLAAVEAPPDETTDSDQPSEEPASIPLPGDPVPMPGDPAGASPSSAGEDAGGGISGSLGPLRYQLQGYVEDTVMLEWLSEADELTVLNATRVRANLGGRLSQRLDFNIGLVGLLYIGATEIDAARYLPVGASDALVAADPATGTPGTADLMSYTLEPQIYIQEAFGTLYVPYFRLRVGRHKFYTGSGFAFNPIDLFTRKDPLDPTYEVDGIDAILMAVELPHQMEIQGILRFSDRFQTTDYLGRFSVQIGRLDLAVQYTHAVRHRTDWGALNTPEGIAAIVMGAPLESFQRSYRWHLVAAEIAGELWSGGIGIHAEGGYAFVDPIGDQGTLDEGSHERLLVGIDYTFSFQLYFLIEYLRLGRGAASASEITLSDRMAYLTGEILAIDRDTLFVGLSYPVADLIEIAVYGVVGLNDPSAIINPWIIFDVTSGLKLSVTAFVPVGGEESQNGRSGAGGFARLRFSY